MKYHSVKDPIRIYIEVLGGKWRLLILHQLFSNTQRFKDLLKTIEGITPRMLTKELRMLEKFNLVEKEVYKEVPPRVEYSLTDEGVKLYPLIENIKSVGVQLAHLISEEVSIEHNIAVEYIHIEATEEVKEIAPEVFQESAPIEEEMVEAKKEPIADIKEEVVVKTETPPVKKIEPPKEKSVIQLELF